MPGTIFEGTISIDDIVTRFLFEWSRIRVQDGRLITADCVQGIYDGEGEMYIRLKRHTACLIYAMKTGRITRLTIDFS